MKSDEELPLLRYADTRQCSECRQVKPTEQFPAKKCPKRGKTYRLGTCRACVSAEACWRWRNKITPEQKKAKRKRNREAYQAFVRSKCNDLASLSKELP